jgi:hypothetical protein
MRRALRSCSIRLNAGNALDVKATETAARTMRDDPLAGSASAEGLGERFRLHDTGARRRPLRSSDPLITHHRQKIAALAAENHIPAIYMHTHFKVANIRRRIRTASCHCLILRCEATRCSLNARLGTSSISGAFKP